MFKQPLSMLSAIFSIGLLAGCAGNPPATPAPFQPVAIDVTPYAPKVDSFVVILDVSSSMKDGMQDTTKFKVAKDLVVNLNQTVPPLHYSAGLVTFGKSSGWSFGRGKANVVYGVTPYQSADLASAVSSIEKAGGTTPMDKGIKDATGALSGESGAVAVIIVSDFWEINSAAVMNAVSKLKAQHGDNLCLHTIQVGNAKKAAAVTSRMTGIGSCGSAVNAADIASGSAMAAYVTETLLAPIQYEKHSVSATALFEFDKSDLHEQGKAELHTLDEYIKSKGIKVVDINVIGHTDSLGSEEYNQGLSERRANAVKAYMVNEGIDAGIIDATGEGELNPVADNSTSEGQALNRRVDIHVGGSQPIK
jgi:OOP family OmpA-OmpF porin